MAVSKKWVLDSLGSVQIRQTQKILMHYLVRHLTQFVIELFQDNWC